MSNRLPRIVRPCKTCGRSISWGSVDESGIPLEMGPRLLLACFDCEVAKKEKRRQK